MKKLMAIFITAVMAFSMAACSSESKYTRGTYTGTAEGRNGDVTVEVVLTADAIESVTVTEHQETRGVADPAIEKIPARIVEEQSLAVDTVSGATITSEAIITAVTNALESRGVDVSTLMTKTEKTGSTEDRDVTTKLLVIGGGGTGLSTALSAYSNGTAAEDIIIVEKLAVLGGSAGMSGAVFQGPMMDCIKDNFPGYTEEQWLQEWKDWVDGYNELLGEDTGYPNYDRVAKYISYLTPTLTWLEEDYDIVHWTNYRYMEGTNFVIPEEIIVDGVQQFVGGNVITDGIAKVLEENGTDIRMETAGKKLVVEDGKVIGAVVEDADGEYTIYADNVVLATGGYSRDAELLEEYSPSYVNYIDIGTATAGDTGDGIKMAREIGARMYDNGAIISVGTNALNSAASDYCGMMTIGKSMLVNSDGERFMDESLDYYSVSLEVAAQEGGVAWVIIGDSRDDATDLGEDTVTAPPIPGEDDTSSVNAMLDACDGENLVHATSIEELAELIGADPETLKASVELYNKDAEAKLDSVYGKVMTPDMAVAGENFYAAKVGVSMAGTIGGVKTDLDGRVLNEDGEAIEGLWAGGCVSNRELLGHTYYHGAGFGYALVSGKIIGEAVNQ